MQKGDILPYCSDDVGKILEKQIDPTQSLKKRNYDMWDNCERYQ